ncbi:MAG: hypothetical protein HY833_01060 [Candidatus Aenigmarchaeota archaeon]|nr:hypothetical protein [Candidatus Aenigmarchaeota archaeon]
MGMKGAEGVPLIVVFAVIVVVIVVALAYMFTLNTANRLEVAGEGLVKSISQGACGLMGSLQGTICPSSKG